MTNKCWKYQINHTHNFFRMLYLKGHKDIGRIRITCYKIKLGGAYEEEKEFNDYVGIFNSSRGKVGL